MGSALHWPQSLKRFVGRLAPSFRPKATCSPGHERSGCDVSPLCAGKQEEHRKGRSTSRDRLPLLARTHGTRPMEPDGGVSSLHAPSVS